LFNATRFVVRELSYLSHFVKEEERRYPRPTIITANRVTDDEAGAVGWWFGFLSLILFALPSEDHIFDLEQRIFFSYN
jgi:hypothetical protein